MSRRPDVVIVGAGMVAGVHAAACDALGWKVRAVVSRSPERAAELASKVGARPVTVEQLAEQVTAERWGDMAIVATPPARHVDDAVALLDAGYQVVVEAPIACTLADADRLIAAEQRVGRSVLYSEHLASSPVVDTLLSRVGGIGAVTHLSARAVQGPPSWRHTGADDWGGGALFDLGVHPIGLVIRTAAEAGIGAPVSVSAVINDAGTDHERATVKLHFEAGTLATINVGWQPGAAPDADLQVSSARAVLRAELYPAPTLEANGSPVPVGGSTSAPVATATPSLVEDYGYAPQLRRFWTNIRTGRPVPATSAFGRQVLDVVCAAHVSARSAAADVELPFTGPRDRTPHQLVASLPDDGPELV